MKQEIKDILSKYISSESKSSEKEDVNNILGGTKYKKDVQDFMVNNWSDVLEDDTKLERDFDPILHKVHHELRINEYKNQNRFSSKVISWYKYAAAILLLPIIVSSVGYLILDQRHDKLLSSNYSSIVIESHNGQIINFDLPDGTKGVLNAGSKISYQIPFTENRNVALTGSAFFAVKHDKKNPFTVNTSKIDVTVLGTRFGIEAYEEDESANVTLEEGKVLCEIPSIGKKVIMKPDEKLLVDNNKILLSKVNASDLLGWKDGLLIFRDEEMPSVVTKLMRWYNVSIVLEDVDLKKYSFRATFEDEPIEEVLKLLARTSPIKYKIEKRKMDDNGIYTRKTIRIYKRKK